jgi:hypothetical protein
MQPIRLQRLYSTYLHLSNKIPRNIITAATRIGITMDYNTGQICVTQLLKNLFRKENKRNQDR